MPTFKINLNKGLMAGGSFRIRTSQDENSPPPPPPPPPPVEPSTYNLVYNLLDLEYIQNIGHHIYNSNYDIN